MRIVLSVLGTVVVLAYPFAIYYGVTRWSARTAGLAVLGLVLLATLSRVGQRWGEELWPIIRIPLAMAVVVAAGALLDTSLSMLALPVVVNLILLYNFAGSLRTETPLVERFARLQDPDLTSDEIVYCRRLTVLWSAYFVFNAVVCTSLAIWAPLGWWTVYTGVVAYVGIGVIFTVEYLFRKYRFRRFGNGLHDRVLQRIMPEHPSASVE